MLLHCTEQYSDHAKSVFTSVKNGSADDDIVSLMTRYYHSLVGIVEITHGVGLLPINITSPYFLHR